MAKFNFRSIFTLSFIILYAECAINFQTIFNARNETQFTVLDSHFVKIPNAQRSLTEKPEMKLSISSQIDQVSNSNSTWILKLGDQSTLDISVKNSSSLTEWIFVWKNYGTKNSGTKNPEPHEICIHYSDAHWYNTYQSANHTFPMDPKSKSGTHQFGFLHASLYDYPNEFHAVLEYLFVSSDGFGLLLDSQVPWFVRFDPSAQDPKFCFSVNGSWPYETENHDPGYLNMKIHIFGSKNVRTVTDYVIHESGLIPKPSKIPDSRLFTHPTWSSFVTDLFHHKTEDEIANLMTNITKYGFSDLKNDISVEIYFDEKMSRNLGNHFEKFPISFEPTVREMHRNGYSFGVLVNGVVDDRTLDNRDFYLKNEESTCIDFSNPEAREYWKNLLETMKLKHKIDSFTILNYDFDKWTKTFKFFDPLTQKYPSLHTKKYVETASAVTSSEVTQMAFKNQDLPIFVQLYPYFFHSVEQKLEHLIPSVLSLSIGGYSFISAKSYLGTKPTAEQYIRWVQATALLPSNTIAHAPWAFGNETVVNITQKFLKLHEEYAPVLIELAKKRVKDGSPIVRPLWYVAPDEPATYTISDQYMVGEDILVAPILREGQHERAVYLPAGQWIDQHGKTYTGGGVGEQVKISVPLDELPIFKRKH